MESGDRVRIITKDEYSGCLGELQLPDVEDGVPGWSVYLDAQKAGGDQTPFFFLESEMELVK